MFASTRNGIGNWRFAQLVPKPTATAHYGELSISNHKRLWRMKTGGARNVSIYALVASVVVETPRKRLTDQRVHFLAMIRNVLLIREVLKVLWILAARTSPGFGMRETMTRRVL
jgi:hypothetical protein